MIVVAVAILSVGCSLIVPPAPIAPSGSPAIDPRLVPLVECHGLARLDCLRTASEELERAGRRDVTEVERIVVSCPDGDPCRASNRASQISIDFVDGTSQVTIID